MTVCVLPHIIIQMSWEEVPQPQRVSRMSHVTLTRIKKRREPVLDNFTCRVWCASVVAFLIAVGVALWA
jgi:hypothetical protein